MAPSRIVFHHIPKCGGSSLTLGLAMAYFPLRLLMKGKEGFPGTLNVAALELVRDLHACDRAELERQLLLYQMAKDNSPFIFGHYPFSRLAYDQFCDRWAFVTLLRDPAERWYSEYFYNRYKGQGVGKTELGLEAYLESRAGRSAARSFVNFLIEAEDPSARASPEEAKQALESLECFDVVGRLEDLPGFGASMQRRFGRKPFMPHVNRSPADGPRGQRPDPLSEVHRKLLDLLAADIEIYRLSQDMGS